MIRESDRVVLTAAVPGEKRNGVAEDNVSDVARLICVVDQETFDERVRTGFSGG
jgi:hypothetical protein